MIERLSSWKGCHDNKASHLHRHIPFEGLCRLEKQTQCQDTRADEQRESGG